MNLTSNNGCGYDAIQNRLKEHEAQIDEIVKQLPDDIDTRELSSEIIKASFLRQCIKYVDERLNDIVTKIMSNYEESQNR